ncbi:MAG: ATP-binding cassette domain-containing protein [Candidatus Aminicenantes bacterium]|nr:ATP-binding cassette domain-containing protein [Candidatus Aminicenantes bacterium]NIM78289.1 ATP-binding cassette domain-containing protein [Candidatus Aminicenantes bacterium]NIN19715.1 ATP-binding cassette domain-containing protein [Candidatus Aminicenantes bacterium]NIN43597.1 ATP-binding cassette domain-containing protein [Candidatus Aminicenantes bacterium]NIN86342.1 ATP-binding cassette domain-containing protein [Candidatus Aminicenantes bacterium]
MSEYETVLELDNLVKDFNGKRAVDNISLKLKRGEIMGLLGPNGAGKTTTLRMILNIIAPDSGTIKILGQNFSEKIKEHIGFLPEERGLYRKMKVSETLTFFGQLKGLKSEDIKTKGMVLLKKFDLADYYDKKVEELSKGMAQKLQFITTILHSPEVLILDEPFAGLDPVNIELVKDIILEKKREGITIIFSTHLMEYAEKIVDSVVMINNGKKVIDGSLSDVKAEYGTKFIKVKYDGDASFVSALDYVKGVRDYGNEMEIEPKDITFKDTLLKDMMGKISISGFQVTEPSLNHIFIRKVNEGNS